MSLVILDRTGTVHNATNPCRPEWATERQHPVRPTQVIIYHLPPCPDCWRTGPRGTGDAFHAAVYHQPEAIR